MQYRLFYVTVFHPIQFAKARNNTLIDNTQTWISKQGVFVFIFKQTGIGPTYTWDDAWTTSGFCLIRHKMTPTKLFNLISGLVGITGTVSFSMLRNATKLPHCTWFFKNSTMALSRARTTAAKANNPTPGSIPLNFICIAPKKSQHTLSQVTLRSSVYRDTHQFRQWSSTWRPWREEKLQLPFNRRTFLITEPDSVVGGNICLDRSGREEWRGEREREQLCNRWFSGFIVEI